LPGESKVILEWESASDADLVVAGLTFLLSSSP